jgi:imidazolonepropionase-like amidohydrolase
MTASTDVLESQYDADQVRLVVTEAHAAGLPVTAHAHGLPSVKVSLAAGVDGIEHCSCFTASGIRLPDSVLQQLVTSGTTVCPTLGMLPGLTPPPAVLAMQQRTGTTIEARQALAGQLYAAGVNVVTGVDAGISGGKAHGAQPFAVAALVAGGVAPTPALASATSLAAQACGLGDRKGRLRAGHDADVLVVEGDPTRDITSLERPMAVYLRGRSAC